MKKLARISLVGLLMFALACQSLEPEEALQVTTPATDQDGYFDPGIFPGVTGEEVTIQVNGGSVSAIRTENNYVVEGDILFSRDELVNGRTQASGRVTRLWDDGIVPYVIDEDMPASNRQYIKQAMAHWQQHTSLRFVPRTSQDNYVEFEPSDKSCSSKLGMVGGRQEIKLTTTCHLAATIHEIGHCVGLFHEHTRIDRDKYITINWENIVDGWTRQFDRADIRWGKDAKDWTDHLDYHSIMMYGSTALSKNGKPTIVRNNGKPFPRRKAVLVGGTQGLSYDDIRGINRMYPTRAFIPNPNKWYRILSQKHRNRGLHDAKESYGRGNYVITSPYKGYPSQKWRFIPQGDGSYRILSRERGGRGLRDADRTYGEDKRSNYVVTFSYLDDAAQHWRIARANDGYYRLYSKRHPGRALRDANRTYSNSKSGNYVVTSPRRGREAEKWRFQEVGDISTDARSASVESYGR